MRKQLQKIRNKAVIYRIKESAENLQEIPCAGKSLRGYPGVRSKRIGTPEGEYRLVYEPVKERGSIHHPGGTP
ncbi:MAG: hypothetical protein V3V85_00280 [Candidatus Thorarchaeota archaeon]